MYLSKTPEIIKPLASSFVWDVPHVVDEVFITFDDGPIPEVTPAVLDILDEFNAKATFFCVGNNAEKHPELVKQLLGSGHAIGNHSWAHENGWKTGQFSYLRSVMKTDELLKTTLFRPPYGRITKQQVDALKKKFTLVMWDVLSGDFDPNISPAQCLRNLTENTRPGSIIVFHDSLKAQKTMLAVLPDFLRFLQQSGWHSRVLNEPKNNDGFL